MISSEGVEIDEPDLPKTEQELLTFLADDHEAFSLEDGEHRETDLIQLEIDTGDSPSKRQPLRKMPFAARQEVAKQPEGWCHSTAAISVGKSGGPSTKKGTDHTGSVWIIVASTQ